MKNKYMNKQNKNSKKEKKFETPFWCWGDAYKPQTLCLLQILCLFLNHNSVFIILEEDRIKKHKELFNA